ncbi:MAG: hypothetical protein PVG39_27015, partial [Desulfobacteraceae bacterium]
MGESNSSKIQIIVAIIGLVGVITTALFAYWDKLFPPDQIDNNKEYITKEEPIRHSNTTAESNANRPITPNSQGAQA